MSFHVQQAALINDVAQAYKQIGSELYSGPAPESLHHYTHGERVCQIADSRSVWATCIADQKDQSEVSHAIELMRKLVEQEIKEGVSHFTREVLQRLAFYMEERRKWVFIACFCGNQQSDYLWKNYGEYCLTFPAPWMGSPSLTCLDVRADCWYCPVVYEQNSQEHAFRLAIRALTSSIKQFTSGDEIDPGSWIAQSCAKNIAQLLLGLSLGFKKEEFRDEEEWRIICCPRLAANNSAPAIADENFQPHIKENINRHILLQIPREHRLFEPLLIPSVPFMHLSRKPDYLNDNETCSIRDTLRANNRLDLMFK
jgi:hypothetical protein